MRAARQASHDEDQKTKLQVIRSFRWFATWLAVACASQAAAPASVRPGIQVLLTDSLHLVRGRRVGILTNQTGVDRTGKSDIDLLRQSGINLTAIFSPEHGFRGNLDRENIGNSVDSATGVPIFSLYGSTRAPTSEMLSRIDVLLVDLQDIGGRPYTYISTTLLALEAAKTQDRLVVILDRPNPIGGELVQGPLLDSAFGSFVGMLPVPLRHGLTLGELARYGNDRLHIGARLTVAPVAGWHRGQWFDATGLPWIRPSPNMPDLESATHYPGIVMFEATNLSVGRGTPIAFQLVGAPWLDTKKVLAALGTEPGVRISDTTVTPVSPGDGKFADQTLHALRFKVTSRAQYDPTRLAVRLLVAIRSVHPDSLKIDAARLAERAGSDRVGAALESRVSADSVWSSWRAGLKAFERERQRYLLYR